MNALIIVLIVLIVLCVVGVEYSAMRAVSSGRSWLILPYPVLGALVAVWALKAGIYQALWLIPIVFAVHLFRWVSYASDR